MSFSSKIKSLRAPFFKLFLKGKPEFTCPLCHYHGPFKDKKSRLHAKCPKCGELERVRLQYLVYKKVFDQIDTKNSTILHIAPERSLSAFLKQDFGKYISADLFRQDVDMQFDVQEIPLEDASVDVVYASHILLYPHDDIKAISEIRRILKPNGIAILPMPIFAEKTVDDFGENVRWTHQSGLDYFDRYRQFFDHIDLYYSHMFPETYQLYLCDNDTDHPLYIGNGKREDIVPICYVSAQESY